MVILEVYPCSIEESKVGFAESRPRLVLMTELQISSRTAPPLTTETEILETEFAVGH